MRGSRAFVALAAVLAVAAAVALLIDGSSTGAPGRYPVLIVGPDGTLWNGTVDVTAATPLSVLEAAAQEGGFALDVQGTGCDAYVRGIAGHQAQGQSGWLFEVRDGADGAWRHPLRSAGCVPLEPGDAVRWTWSDDGVY